MKNFLAVFCLITISTFGVFAQNKDTQPVFSKTVIDSNIKDLEKYKSNEPDIIQLITDKDIADKPPLTKPLIEKIETRQDNNSDHNKNEFFVGYSYQNIDRRVREHFNGFNVSYVRNVTRYIGIKGDVSGAYKNESFEVTSTFGTDTSTSSIKIKNQLYNFLGGIQIKDNASKKKLKPFAHALVGATYDRVELSSRCLQNCTGIFLSNKTVFTDSLFAGAFGGGLDIKINDKIDFRAIQFDYNPFFRSSGVNNNNFRIGVGVVFK